MGLSLFLGISGGCWATMHWLSTSIESRIKTLAVLNVDIKQASETLAQLEETTWGVTLNEIDGERFVVLPAGSLDYPHSINVSRLLQAEDEKPDGPFKHPERHILDNVTVFGMKYTHIVVIECALYLYEMLADGGHIERLADEKWRLRLSFVTLDEVGFFSAKQDWLRFAGGLILTIGTAERSITHRIRPVGTPRGSARRARFQ